MSNKKDLDKNITPTLKSLTKLAEEQRELMSKLSLGSSLSEIDKLSKQIKTTLASPAIQSAFKTTELYSSTLKDLEKSFASKNKTSIQELFNSTLPSSLKKDFGLAFKAADQFKETEEYLKSLGLLADKSKGLADLTKGLTGVKSTLDYAKEISKATTGLSQLGLTQRMKRVSEGIDMVGNRKVQPKDLMKHTKLDISSSLKEIHDREHEIIKIQQERFEKKEKREQKLYENSETQVELLNSIINYMKRQSQNLTLQNDILSEQVENLKLQNSQAEEQINEIKKQNKIMQEQQKENRKSSNIALSVAIVVGIGSIVLPYFIYQWQDKSDNKNHSELLQVIQKSKNNKELKLLLQKQIESSNKTNQLLEKLLKQTQQKNKQSQTKQPKKSEK